MPHALPIRLVLGCLLSAAAAHAIALPAFVPQSHKRSVHIQAELQMQDHDSGEGWAHTHRDGDEAPAGEPGPVSLFAGASVSDPGGWIFAQGAAIQQSAVAPNRIAFSGLADINISGHSGYPVYTDGNGHSAVRFELAFSVPKALTVALEMNSEVQRFREDDWRFLLAHADGTPVWQDTEVIDDNGRLQRSFVQQLRLAPGDYVIQASLHARSWWQGDMGFAGRSSGSFTMAPVPEPATAALALLGLALLALRRRPGRR